MNPTLFIGFSGSLDDLEAIDKQHALPTYLD